MRLIVTLSAVFALTLCAYQAVLAQGEPTAGAGADQRYVCIKKWGIARDEGFCGMAREKDADNLSIRVMRTDRTVWRTGGTKCSAGLNLKDFLPGITIVVPKSCL